MFFGSPEAAVPSLEALVEVFDVAAVVTQPGRRSGRGRSVRPTPVAEAAQRLGLPVHEPSTKDELRSIDLACDVAVVVAFGMIIPPDVLVRPTHGFLNLHFSLLPAWRGAAPVERAILSGDETTGVCLMQMDEGLDTGPVFACRERSIEHLNAGDVTTLLAEDGATLLKGTLPAILDRTLVAVAQEGEATYAPKITAGEGRLDPWESTASVERRIRAFTPRPGAWFDTDEGRLKIGAARPDPAVAAPGELRLDDGRLVIGTLDGALHLIAVQSPGGRMMTGSAWANGRRGRMPAIVQ